MNVLQAYDHARLADCSFVLGVDESGRGCLAGPVVASACVLSSALFESEVALARTAAINDSKQLSAQTRDAQYAVLEELRADNYMDFEVASASVDEIAQLNILGATRLAMRRAIEALAGRAVAWTLPNYEAAGSLLALSIENFSRRSADLQSVRILVDGRPLKPFPYAHEGVIKGDGKSLSIAMASIAAKVTRDRAMMRLAETYPAYSFERHKGYGTAVHRAALKAHGSTPIHRELFLRKLQ